MLTGRKVKGKIVLVPFPFDDLSAVKVRPALCLTDALGPHYQVVLAFITSQVPADLLDTDLVLIDTEADFRRTGLRLTLTIRLARLMTVSMSIIERQVGILPESARPVVFRKLRNLFVG